MRLGATGSVLGLALAAMPSPANGQDIRGTLVSEGQPVVGAVVWLLDADKRVTRVFTDSLGRFLLRAPSLGTYELLAERIGMASARSGGVMVGVNGVGGYVFEVAPSPVGLPAIAVDADRRCSGVSDGEGTYRVWDEARKSLEAIVLTEGLARTRFAVVSYERELDARSLAVRREAVSARGVLSRVPLRSAPPDELAREGYVRESNNAIEYYAPDATVLLSTSFAERHCFRMNFAEDRPAHVGLEFRPTEDAGPPDVEGTLWLHRESGTVVDLEFRFTRLPWPVRDRRIGGYLAFEQLGNGQQIVRSWWLRMPILSRQIGGAIGSPYTVAGYRQIGAEVVEQAPLLASTLDRLRILPADTTDSRADSAAQAPPADSVFVLPGLDVEARASRQNAVLARIGFYERQAISTGRFLERAEIERMSVHRASDLFERFPGIRTRPIRQGYGSVVWFSGTERPGGPTGMLLCGPRLLINGVNVFTGGTTEGPLPIDEYVNVHEITAIEIYRNPAEIPAQYGGPESACGVIIIWTVG